MLAVIVVLGVAALVGFVVLEERGRPDVAVYTAVVVTVLDALFFPSQGSVPYGLFRPVVGGQDLRLVDLVIAAGLVARLVVRGLPRRVTADGLAWTLFMAWYAFAGVVGFAHRQPTDLVLFQAKTVLETGGMIVLVAGVPMARLTARTVLDRLGTIGGVVAGIALALAVTGVSIDLPLPPGAQLGEIKPDAATLLFSLGMIVLVTGACRDDRNRLALLGGAVMAATPLVADQRAAIAGALPVVALVAFAMGGRTWRRRPGVRGGAIVPLLAVLLLPLGIAAAVAATDGAGTAELPLAARLSDTFGSEQKQQSADVRRELVDDGLRLVEQRPLLGHGLGQPVELLDQAENQHILIGDFHNIALDLAVRTGLVGLGLFALAVALSCQSALGGWRRIVDDTAAALVLAAGTVLAGLVVKGLFETIFQKFRLAVLLGLLIGVIAASSRSARRQAGAEVDRPAKELAWT